MGTPATFRTGFAAVRCMSFWRFCGRSWYLWHFCRYSPSCHELVSQWSCFFQCFPQPPKNALESRGWPCVPCCCDQAWLYQLHVMFLPHFYAAAIWQFRILRGICSTFEAGFCCIHDQPPAWTTCYRFHWEPTGLSSYSSRLHQSPWQGQSNQSNTNFTSKMQTRSRTPILHVYLYLSISLSLYLSIYLSIDR